MTVHCTNSAVHSAHFWSSVHSFTLTTMQYKISLFKDLQFSWKKCLEQQMYSINITAKSICLPRSLKIKCSSSSTVEPGKRGLPDAISKNMHPTPLYKNKEKDKSETINDLSLQLLNTSVISFQLKQIIKLLVSHMLLLKILFWKMCSSKRTRLDKD